MHVHVAVLPGEENSFSAERSNTIAHIRAFMQKAPIAKAAVITIAQKGDINGTRSRNDSIIALTRRYPELVPVCSVHPMDGAAAFAEMERVHQQGVKIIKLHPNSQQFDVAAPEVAAVAQKADSLQMVLLFDSYSPLDANEIGKLIILAVTHPGAQFIFAHMGLVNFPQLLTIEALKKYPWYKKNIWFDISAAAPILGDSPFHDQLVWTIRKIGIEQFMFGSDYPLFEPADVIASVRKMGFTAAEEKQLFYTNACRLLGINP